MSPLPVVACETGERRRCQSQRRDAASSGMISAGDRGAGLGQVSEESPPPADPGGQSTLATLPETWTAGFAKSRCENYGQDLRLPRPIPRRLRRPATAAGPAWSKQSAPTKPASGASQTRSRQVTEASARGVDGHPGFAYKAGYPTGLLIVDDLDGRPGRAPVGA